MGGLDSSHRDTPRSFGSPRGRDPRRESRSKRRGPPTRVGRIVACPSSRPPNRAGAPRPPSPRVARRAAVRGTGGATRFPSRELGGPRVRVNPGDSVGLAIPWGDACNRPNPRFALLPPPLFQCGTPRAVPAARSGGKRACDRPCRRGGGGAHHMKYTLHGRPSFNKSLLVPPPTHPPAQPSPPARPPAQSRAYIV